MSRVLVVEDEEAIRRIVALSLGRVGGWAVETAADGHRAAGLIAAGEHFDAVLLDVMMPGLDGLETLVLLRREGLGEETPVVFLTAKAQAADRRRLLGLGATGVITKPFDPMALPAELDVILRSAPSAEEPGGLDPAPTWRRFGAEIERRVELIATALGRPPEGPRGEALRAAHQLAGLLGTIGSPRGSRAAHALEASLAGEDGGQTDRAGDYELLAELRSEVARGRSASLTTSSGSA